MAAHSSANSPVRIPWTEESGGLQPMGMQSRTWRSKWTHTYCSLVHHVVYGGGFRTAYFPLQVALVPYQKCCCRDKHMYRYEYWTWGPTKPPGLLPTLQKPYTLSHTHTHTHTHTFPEGKGINRLGLPFQEGNSSFPLFVSYKKWKEANSCVSQAAC